MIKGLKWKDDEKMKLPIKFRYKLWCRNSNDIFFHVRIHNRERNREGERRGRKREGGGKREIDERDKEEAWEKFFLAPECTIFRRELREKVT